uniref:Uncharacterized protein n=1 Tax=Oryza meridionalis TaxID=40149 RepID=A0A0E0D8S0_9ORYZ
MNKDAHKHLGVIKFHSCLVPPMNMRELVTRMKIQLFKLKKISQADYSRVLKGLLYPPDWEDLILRYRDLIVMYNSRGRWSQTNNQIPPAGLGQSQLPVGLAQGQGQPQPSSRLGQSQGLVNAMSGLPLPPKVNKGKGVAWAQGKATSTATTVPPVPIKPQPHAGLAQGQGQPQPSTRLGQSQGLVNAMSGLPLPPQSNKGQATGTAATVPIKGQVPFQGSNKQTGATNMDDKGVEFAALHGSRIITRCPSKHCVTWCPYNDKRKCSPGPKSCCSNSNYCPCPAICGEPCHCLSICCEPSLATVTKGQVQRSEH